MTASPRVLVLCNGASGPEDMGEYKNVLSLVYNSNVPGKRNIKLSLPDFVRDVYHLPDRLLDLLEIAAYVFSADRLIGRGEHDAVDYHTWARSFEFRIRVRDHAFWSQDGVKHKLAEALTFSQEIGTSRSYFNRGIIHRQPVSSTGRSFASNLSKGQRFSFFLEVWIHWQAPSSNWRPVMIRSV
jgi:hypothetical protein